MSIRASKRMSEIYTWKSSPGKGNGIFANRALPPGTLIMRDVEVMKIPNELFKPQDDQHFDPTQDAFDSLSLAEKSDFLQLHEGDQPLPSRVARIFKANAFVSQDDEFSFMYLNICKANHSCRPNAEVLPHETLYPSEPRLVAIKHIAQDEEIFISYSAFLTMKPRHERQGWLHQNFDFNCSCATCNGTPHDIALSDARRSLLSILCPALQDPGDIPQLKASRQRALSRPELASKWQSLLLTSPTATKCSFNLLIARLLEAEGLPVYQAGSAYLDAATHLLTQMRERDDGIILLGAAENVKTWIEAGRNIIVTLHGVESVKGREVSEFAKDLDEKYFELYVVGQFYDSVRDVEADGDLLEKLNETFALQAVFEDDGVPAIRPMSEGGCRKTVRRHRVDPTAKLESARAMDAYMESCRA